MSDLLVLYGATGQTGRHILPLALEQGLRVRCYVRSPDKIPAEHREHESVEIVQGTFEDTAGVSAAIEGAQLVICVGGGPSTYKAGLMVDVAKAIVAGMNEHGCKRLVYQAGAFSPEPGQQNPFFVRWFLRPMLGTMFGITGMLHDNDQLMAWVKDNAPDLDWTFTRPGQIVEAESMGELKVSDQMSSKCTFADLAKLDLQIATSGSHRHGFPYVNY